MLSLISLNLPGEATMIQKTIIQISQLDILPSEIFVDYILSFDPSYDRGITTQFNEAGYESFKSIKNMGSTFLYLIINCSLLIILGIFKLATILMTR